MDNRELKNLVLLGSLSFSLAFGLGIVVERNIIKSATIGGIATISTISSAVVLNKKKERELKAIQRASENLKSIENKVLALESKNQKLLQSIESKTRSKIALDNEYNSIFRELNNLKQEISSLSIERDNLQSLITNLESKKQEIAQTIPLKPEVTEKKKTGLYNYILDGLKNSGDFYITTLHGSFENYLQSLQKTAEQLWYSYRANQVKVNYSDSSIQAVYLMRYYPHYAYANFQILEILHTQNLLPNLISDLVEVCLFGAGPCPEIIGLGKLLSEQYHNIKKLIVNVYDIASQEWTLSRNLTEKFIVPEYWSGDLTLNSNYFDLCESDSLYSIKTTIKKSKIFMFQNCLNEIYNTFTVQENLTFLLDEMSSDSVLIIIDLNYRQNTTIINQLKEQINNRPDFEIYSPSIQDINIKACPNLPPIIKEHLLTGKGKLIPRSKDINCLFISLRKVNQKD